MGRCRRRWQRWVQGGRLRGALTLLALQLEAELLQQAETHTHENPEPRIVYGTISSAYSPLTRFLPTP